MRLRLVDHGYSFKKIVSGKKWIGRVYFNNNDSLFYGKIGDHVVSAKTEIGAFNEVTARAFGFSSAGELDARNARVRANNRIARARANKLVNDLLFGDAKSVIEALFNNKV